jgi:hypothetical protein
MHRCRLLIPALLATVGLAASPEETMVAGPVQVKSLSKLTFGPDGILFVADSIGARIWALDLNDRTPAGELKKVEINDLEGKLAGLLGADPRDVMIHDMAVNPISRNTYLTVSRGRRSFTQQWQLPNDVANASVLLRITPSGEFEEVRLDRVKRSFVDISNPVDDKVVAEYKTSKARVDAVSDMAFADGKLIVAGLSNEEFSSTMRVYSFPFDGKGTMTSIEIYHGSHGKYETNSPVRTFLPIRINGKAYIMASYLCTPLVLFPMDEMKDKQHLKGRTIAELGDGNYPLDMVAFQYKGRERIMIVNSTRGVVLINTDDLSKPLAPITIPIEGTAGIPFQYLRNRGILQVENFGDKNLLVLSRNSLNGEVSLWTMPVELD